MEWTEDTNLISFINGIMQGFRTSRTEALILLAVITVFLAATVTIFIIQNRKKYLRRLSAAESRFREKIEDIKLSELERNVLEAMAKELPRGEFRKHEVVTEKGAFDCAAKRLIARREISEEIAASLRLKLEFGRATEQEPVYTTAEIPEGKHLYIVDKLKNRYHGYVREITPEHFIMQIRGKAAEMPRKKKLRVYLKQKSGVYSFTTSIIDINEDLLTCAHSDSISREQKRQFYRKEIDDKAHIEKKGAGKEERRTVSVYDLGGGGARIENPGHQLAEGDEIELFLPVEGATLTVPAEVVTSSKNGSVLHLEFTDIPESKRDKIIGYVLQY